MIETGLDVLACAKRESKGEGNFKVPKDRTLAAMSALEEDEKSASSGLDEVESDLSCGSRRPSGRHYRGTISQESPRSGKWL